MIARLEEMGTTRYVATEIIGVDTDVVEYQRLALRVMCQAIDDGLDPRPARSADTRAFFTPGHRWLEHWCTLANLDPAVVVEGFHRELERRERLTVEQRRRMPGIHGRAKVWCAA